MKKKVFLFASIFFLEREYDNMLKTQCFFRKDAKMRTLMPIQPNIHVSPHVLSSPPLLRSSCGMIAAYMHA